MAEKPTEFQQLNRCTACNCAFSLILRRHHCRSCRKSFCSSCAPSPSKNAPRRCQHCQQHGFDSRYTGKWLNGLREGFGTLADESGLLVATWGNGRAVGSYTNHAGDYTYEGEFDEDGDFHGKGTVKGQIVDGNKRFGSRKTRQGEMFEAELVFEKSDIVKGKVVFSSDIYEGELNEYMQPHGEGIYEDANGIMIGTFDNGQLVQYRRDLDIPIALAVTNKRCTYTETSKRFYPQQSFICKDCFGGDLQYAVVCESCAERCHKGHDVIRNHSSGGSYCDCGLGRGETPCSALTELPLSHYDYRVVQQPNSGDEKTADIADPPRAPAIIDELKNDEESLCVYQKKIGTSLFGKLLYGLYYNSPVAVMVIDPNVQATMYKDLLWSEIKYHITLQHENVCEVYEIRDNDGAWQVIQEFFPKGSLQKALDTGELRAWKHKRFVLDGIMKGMIYLHSHGITNQTLKPASIFLTSDLVPKIADFGLARLLPRDDNDLELTQCRYGCQLTYAAPEVLNPNSLEISEKADVYSFSMILYEILTGRKPFDQMKMYNLLDTAQFILSGARPELSQDVSPEMTCLLQDCWQPDPNRRPSFEEIRQRVLDM